MPLIADRVAQLGVDKIADTWADTLAAQQRTESFYEVISDTGDPDVETDIGPGAEIADLNIVGGLEFHPLVKKLMQGFLSHVQEIGGYGTVRQYATARRFRVHRYMADRAWGDSNIASDFVRTNVFPELTEICSLLLDAVDVHVYTDIGDIPATAGGARLRALVGVKGATEYAPEIHAVCEGPATELDGGLASDETDTITVVATADFPAAGHVIIDGEAIEYTGKTATTFTTLTRAQYGTATAAHTSGAAVYKVHTYTPVIWASARPGLLVDLDMAILDDISPAGGTALESDGIQVANEFQTGSYVLVKDHSSPEVLTENCDTDDHLHVADASAFRPGDHIWLHSTAQDEWATIHDVDHAEGVIYLDAATGVNFTTAQSALVCLAFAEINMGPGLDFDGLALTVDAAPAVDVEDGFPAAGTILIDDEEIYYESIAANIITIPAGAAGRAQNGTVAVHHEDDAPVVLIQEGTFPGTNEWHTVAAVGADALTLDDALIHSYWLAAFVVPLLRDVVLTENGVGGDGINGDTGDLITVLATPDRDAAKAG